MARYTGPKCKLCRREGTKLLLKSRKCLTDACPFEKRAYPPGERGGRRRRSRVSDYGLQLREKQKVRRTYGVLEKQFRRYFQRAARQRGLTGDNLMIVLERRLDNVVYRLGLAPTRRAARQLVGHRHVLVNGRRVDIPSYLVEKGDLIEVKESSRKLALVQDSVKRVDPSSQYPWLRRTDDGFGGTFVDYPSREDIPVPFQEQLIVELYSK
jgi:small subunit ribosomal protein S4